MALVTRPLLSDDDRSVLPGAPKEASVSGFIALGITATIFLVLGILATAFGADSRDGFSEEDLHRGLR